MTGQTLSHYQIQEKLGEGGMGVVYKALDTHLNRPVALKLLPADKVSNPERRKRFVQEARAASALNHPNIVTIYDIASHDSHDFIAMEFIQGKTLDQLQRRKNLPLSDTLKYSAQIADALAKAHAAGIVHRDLKPSNIMVTEDGRAKVLDFGLAKLVEPDHVDSKASTRLLQDSAPKTEEGALVGTVAYMSPEQAEGKKLDGRSDIFSFGSVLYEMSTGRRAFRGETKLSTLSAILREEPKPASELAAAVPRELERIIQRCLRKDPARRFQHIDDVKVALEELKEESDSGKLTQVPLAAPNRRTRRLAWIAALLVPAALAGMAWWNWHRQPLEPKQALTQPIPVTSYAGIEGHPTFSPDARQVAFHWNGEKQDNFDIYVKLTDSSAPPLRLTSNPAPDWAPEWSPDGKSIAFIREPGLRGVVYLIPPLGGPERKLCDTRGDVLAWHPDGKRIAIMDRTSGEEPYHITLVDVFTGEGKAVTRPGADHIGDGAPAFSPNGETLAFVRWPIPASGQLHILGLREGGEKALQQRSGSSRLAWTPDSRAIVVDTSLVPIDGSPVRRLESTAGSATDAIVSGGLADGSASLAFVVRTTDQNIWRKDLQPPGASTQIIASTWFDGFPRWSPDGNRIMFSSSRGGTLTIWLSDPNGSNLVDLGTQAGRPNAWSPDGRQILFDDARAPGRVADIFVMSVDGGAPRNLTNRPSDEVRASWSNDGRSIYFRSDRSGRNEIWKMPANGGDATQITRNGGLEAQESLDGKLLYVAKASADKSRAIDSRTVGGTPGGVWSMPVGGGPETLVLASVTFGSWSVASPGIFFIDFTGAQGSLGSKPVRFYEFATKKVTQVALIEKKVTWGNMEFSVTRDGGRLLWSQIDHESDDIMLVRGWKP